MRYTILAFHSLNDDVNIIINISKYKCEFLIAITVLLMTEEVKIINY